MWHRVVLPAVALATLLPATACSPDDGAEASATGGSGAGAPAVGGTSAGGVGATGGFAAGGAPSGGTSAGGSPGGGTPSGGMSSGGTASGGAAMGGMSGGGSPSGGSASGGMPGGGSPSGGMPSGGSASGGAPSGGSASGGTPSGGSASGGTPNGGNAGSAANGGTPSGGASGSGGSGGSPSGGTGAIAGASGGGGSPEGGSGGTAALPRLCILPLGDSITQSNDTHVSYRYPLWESLVEAGYEFDLIGSMNTHFAGTPNYPNPAFDRDHEGHWGWRVDEINAEIQGWLGSYTPDVVLMHLGTNDAFQSQSADSTLGELTDLIGMLRADNERVTILLAKLIPSTNSQNNLDALNTRFDALAASLTTSASPVVVVDQTPGFDPVADTFDGIHPNEGGERKMASKWFDALQANWPSEGGDCAR